MINMIYIEYMVYNAYIGYEDGGHYLSGGYDSIIVNHSISKIPADLLSVKEHHR